MHRVQVLHTGALLPSAFERGTGGLHFGILSLLPIPLVTSLTVLLCPAIPSNNDPHYPRRSF